MTGVADALDRHWMDDSPFQPAAFHRNFTWRHMPDYLRLVMAVGKYCHPNSRYKRWRLISYALLSPRLSYAWYSRLAHSPLLRNIAQQRKNLVERLHRRILRHDYPIARRWQLLTGHYAYLARTLSTENLGQMLLRDGGVRLAKITASGEEFELILGHSGQHVREGELALYWRHSSNPSFLYQMSFILVDGPEGLGIYVGGLQGHGSNTREIVTQCCKWCSGLTPRHAAAEGLFILAHHLGVEYIHGVADAQHTSRSKKGKLLSYDAFWQELGAVQNDDGDFVLPLQLYHKPIEEVESRRRAQYRRRRAHLEEIASQSLATLQVVWPVADQLALADYASKAERSESTLSEAV